MTRKNAVAARQLDALFNRLFYCPSCTTWRTSRYRDDPRLGIKTSRRSQSTLSSSTAVNGRRPVPAQYKALHEALIDVQKKASSYISLSRLQLALQSLESARPVIRLAILGLNVPDTALRIVRLLLADALEDAGRWETQLASGIQDYSRGVIIRFGEDENSNIPRPKTSVPTLNVPSPLLEKNNTEILVSSINEQNDVGILQSRVPTPSESFLSPIIGTPTSETGRQVTIRQPAHRCLVVANGLDQLIATAELLASTRFMSVEDRESIMTAVNLESVALTNPDRKTLVVDVTRAEEGLAAIRKSVKLATEYEHKWIDSGMPALSKWLSLVAVEPTQNGRLKQPVRDLVSSLLTMAMSNLRSVALESSQAATAKGLSPTVLTNLQDAVDQFSRSSHQELQSGLSTAWRSRNWRKLAWYKLFWRVDDVGLIVTDLVTNAWLPKTERAVFEISGRLVQVGINPVTEEPVVIQQEAGRAFEETQQVKESVVLQPEAQLATAAVEPVATQPIIVNQGGTSNIEIEPVPQQIPIASTVSQARNTYISNSITSLTMTAQQLVLRTLSITGLSAGLSGLTYVSLFSSIYEAGTIAAVGTVFALWRMQSGWQSATKKFEDGLFDEGRTTIVGVVDRMKTLVQSRSQVEEDPVETEEREQAENAIARARAELEKLDEKIRE